MANPTNSVDQSHGLNPFFAMMGLEAGAPRTDYWKTKKVVWQPGVQWPSYFSFQVHPNTPVVSMMEKFVKEMTTGRISPELCREIFILPPEYKTYLNSLEKAKNYVGEKKLVDFAPKQWKSLFVEINGEGKRKTEAIIINHAKFYSCPNNKDSFQEIDAYFRKPENQSDFETWKASRNNVWYSVYPTDPQKKQSLALTPTQYEVLCKHNLMMKLPPPKELDSLMDAFCQELPQKMKAVENPFDLMAYAHQKLVQIHYFADGNGRTARTVAGLIADQAGISPVVIEEEKEYLKAASEKDAKSLAQLLERCAQKQRQTLAVAKSPLIEMALKTIQISPMQERSGR